MKSNIFCPKYMEKTSITVTQNVQVIVCIFSKVSLADVNLIWPADVTGAAALELEEA